MIHTALRYKAAAQSQSQRGGRESKEDGIGGITRKRRVRVKISRTLQTRLVSSPDQRYSPQSTRHIKSHLRPYQCGRLSANTCFKPQYALPVTTPPQRMHAHAHPALLPPKMNTRRGAPGPGVSRVSTRGKGKGGLGKDDDSPMLLIDCAHQCCSRR